MFYQLDFRTPGVSFLASSLTLGVVILAFLLFFARARGLILTALLRRAVKWWTRRSDIDVSIRSFGYATLAGKLYLNGVVIRTPYFLINLEESIITLNWWTQRVRDSFESELPSRLSLQLIGFELVVFHSSIWDSISDYVKHGGDHSTLETGAPLLSQAQLALDSTLRQLLDYCPITTVSLSRFACSFGNIRLPCKSQAV